MIWRVDCERESAIKVDYIKNAVISMLNFTGSNVALSYQKHSLRPILFDYIYQ
jgi:hypothetical protein